MDPDADAAILVPYLLVDEGGSGMRLAHVAATMGRVDLLRLLVVEKGADPNAVALDGHTPLLCAIEAGMENAALMLVREVPGVDVHVRSGSKGKGKAKALILAASGRCWGRQGAGALGGGRARGGYGGLRRDVDGRLQRGGGGDVPDGGGGLGLGAGDRYVGV